MQQSFKINPSYAVDAYKLAHAAMYPEGTELVYSNMTPRSGELLKKAVPVNLYEDNMVHFGLQGLIKHYVGLWNENFFNVPLGVAVAVFGATVAPFCGSLTPPVDNIAALHKLGFLPLEIRSLPEGSVVPFKVPVFTVENTIPEFYWLTNYTETYFSNEYWKGTTAATIARLYRKLFTKYAIETGCPLEFVDFQGHDFSARGLSGTHDSATTGAGHLTSFKGSDTLVAADYIRYAYGSSDLIAASVPASEHSVMVSEGPEGELELFRRLITEVVPNGIVSLVADGYDYWKVLTEYSVDLKEDILNRGTDLFGNSKTVFRPDSGNPVDIVCGTASLVFDSIEEAEEKIHEKHYKQAGNDCEGSYNVGLEYYTTIAKVKDKYYEFKTCFEYNRHDKQYYYVEYESATTHKEIQASPEQKGSIEVLWEIFGGTVNEQGYKVLNPKVGLIYGDSITLDRAQRILEGLKNKGFCTSCIVFGIGSFTYQYVTRDTLGLAMKATYVEVNGEGREIFKAPKTDKGTKKSAKGLVQVLKEDGVLKLKDSVSKTEKMESELQLVFFDGVLYNTSTLDQIRARILQN